MDIEKIYAYRFKGIDQERRQAVWKPVAEWIMQRLNHPQRLLEIGAGRCEFINQCGAKDRFALDTSDVTRRHADSGVDVFIGRIQDIDLGDFRFDAVFMSNFLEHLSSFEEAALVLNRAHSLLKPGQGKVAIMGPNFKYAYKSYFDCADHVLALTHHSVCEILAGCGFGDIQVLPRVLPFSFRSAIPSYPILVRLYLMFPPLWKIAGKQFFVIGRR